jgi:hypothetical protein
VSCENFSKQMAPESALNSLLAYAVPDRASTAFTGEKGPVRDGRVAAGENEMPFLLSY